MRKFLFTLVATLAIGSGLANAAGNIIKCTGAPNGCRLKIDSSTSGCSIDLLNITGTQGTCEDWAVIQTQLNSNHCCGTSPWGCDDSQTCSTGTGDACILPVNDCVPVWSIDTAVTTCSCTII